MNRRLPGTLRWLRRQRGLSLKEIASQLGVHFTTVSSWERGRSEPPYETLSRLARLYDVSAGDLLGGNQLHVPRRPFRPLSSRAAETLLREVEELRLAACVGAELGRDQSGEELSGRTGLPPTRLQALAAGEAAFRPTEIAVLVRELKAGNDVEALAGGGAAETETITLPDGLGRRIEEFLAELRSYLKG